jgi:serine/threonine protein kinase
MTDAIGKLRGILALRHPSLLETVGFFPPALPNFPHGAILSENLPNGSLHDVLQSVREGKKLPFWTATAKAKLVAGIVLALAYLHSRSHSHTALHPRNILLDSELEVRIADFGFHRVKPEQSGASAM